jgi:hypothetical protein
MVSGGARSAPESNHSANDKGRAREGAGHLPDQANSHADVGRFLNFGQYDPSEQFAVTLKRSRPAIERAYLAAVEASDRCNALLDESMHRRLNTDGALADLGLVPATQDIAAEVQLADQLHLEAEVEDMQTDWQASVVVLFADDVLRRFTRRVLETRTALEPGYGPTYLGGSVTTLLQAGANAIRHVSEWDDDNTLAFPYDPSKIAKGSDAERAWRNIHVFQRAFGVGKHERIPRDAVLAHRLHHGRFVRDSSAELRAARISDNQGSKGYRRGCG